jgi:hypothetical protein
MLQRRGSLVQVSLTKLLKERAVFVWISSGSLLCGRLWLFGPEDPASS